MTTNHSGQSQAAQFGALGLIANPFDASHLAAREIGIALETAAASNRLLAAIALSARQDRPKPIIVSKDANFPTVYSKQAVGKTEASLIHDESLNIVHAYIQLFMMRKGRVRSTLGTFSDRVAFRSFEQTLVSYVRVVLDAPDDQLASYQVLGEERLLQFKEQFDSDSVATIIEYFGEPVVERRPELSSVADIRLVSLEPDVDESTDSQELDNTVGNAPGTGVGLPEQQDEELTRAAVVDYLIEYTSIHLSKVIARGLRQYRERGLMAMANEWKVTKAPRKTLLALTTFACARFNKVAIMYDEFENWGQIPQDLRRTIVVTLSEMRWMLEENAIFVILLEEGIAPELEEQFGAGTVVRWDFPYLARVMKEGDAFHSDEVDYWVASASLGEPAFTADDPVIAALMSESNESLRSFVTMAGAAIDDAAARGVGRLDDDALAAGRQALVEATEE